MSQNNDHTGSNKTPTNIKIAAKEASQRAASSGQGAADPGPGDPSAAPSVAPQLVDIPDPPTASQLIVKSIKTVEPNQAGSRAASGSVAVAAGSRSRSAAGSAAGGTSGAADPEVAAGGLSAVAGAPSAATGGASGGGTQKTTSAEPSAAVSAGHKTSAGSQQSPIAVSSSAEPSPESQQQQQQQLAPSEHDPSVKTFSKYNQPTSGSSKAAMTSGTHKSGATTSPHHTSEGGRKKTTQRFRYHKRVTVRTKGKTSPSAIMDKVNYKDHKAGITASSIEEMDPQELMKRAGIKDTKKGTHWRVRLRQTEKITKNGKTVTQTKVAYRDSEGNKKVKTSKTPNCEKCNKPLEECECDSTSNH